MTEHKFTDEEKILLLLKFSDNVYANAKLTPEEAKTLLALIKRQREEIVSDLISDVIEILKEAYRRCDLNEVKTILWIENEITELEKKYREEQHE